jgi:prepilin-type N-terminal cleavage/methylation domain-containing protein
VEEALMQRRGFTLVELLVVTAIGFIIALLASPPLFTWMTRQKVEQSGIQFLSDLKYARREAEIQGAVGIMPQDPVNNPTIIDTPIRRIYVALNTQENEYRIYRWQDEDMDGVPETGEFAPDFDNPNNDGVLREGELSGVEFARPTDLNKSPCTNNDSESTDPIVNINSCPVVDGVFADGEYCIRFNAQGFYEGMDNAKIFLFREASRLGEKMYEAYGIALNLTGALQMCRWNCDDWNELGQCLAGEWKRVR